MGELTAVTPIPARPGLGDVGPHDDESYGGQTGYGMDYLRDKAREFQVLLTSLDSAYLSILQLMGSGVISPELYDELAVLADDYEAHKTTLRLTAEAINAGAAVVNAAGGRFPVLSVPGTLGALPALPVAAIAALGTVVALTTWGMSWLRAYNDRTKFELLRDSLPEGERQALVMAEQQSGAALANADPTLFGVLGSSVKWIALAAIAYFAWQSTRK